jgi:L-alanine-DL-glutamate epimerase-like enolase superfamily enzyme
MAAVDMALHDLWAKHLDLPLVEYLGRAHDCLPTSMTIGIKSVEESLEDTDEYLGMGFRILKIKIGKSVDEDLECLSRIREHAGKDVLIRVDANQGYDKETFLKFVEKTAPLDLEFIEQPLGASDLESMRSLPEPVRQMSAADESLHGVRDALTCLQPPRPFGIFNIKLMKCGGIAQGLQIAEIARQSGIDLMWGCMDESIVGITAALHAALASPATRYLDLDGSLDLARDLVEGGFILKDGMLRLTDRPGLGITPLP